MNATKILPVSDALSIRLVESLAREIWREHYTPILGNSQVEYMLEKFQSAKAIGEQIGAGYRYYLIKGSNDNAAGYLAVVPREKELFLSKIYLTCDSRRKGYARQALSFIEALAKEMGLPRITLTVNKNNYTSIEIYRKLGFTVYDSIVADIGNGFVMDDYAMEKIVV